MKKQWQDDYAALPLQTQARVLAVLAHDLTLWARGSYVAVTKDDARTAEILTASNEFLHRLTEQLQSMLQFHEKVYPDAVFLEMCWEYARSAGCQERLADFFQSIHEAYERSKAGTLAGAAGSN